MQQKLEYRNHEEKGGAVVALSEFADFLRKYGYTENAARVEKNVGSFIASIPVRNQNPCMY